METRNAQVVSDSPSYKEGSEGSKLRSNNPKKYDTMSLDENTPNITDHKFESNPIIDNGVLSDSPELTRRENSHSRDRRNGFKQTENTVFART